MAVELVHRLATDNSPQVKKILDNVIFLLVPSLNPDGQIMITDWFNKNLGTPVRNQPDPVPLSSATSATTTTVTCTCSRRRRASSRRSCCGTTGFPRCGSTSTRWGASGARIFVMPATDPINPNVHPLIYRWNGILGPVAGRGARGGRQGRHHLQLDLHELLAGRHGLERLVAQPDRPADGSGERAHRGADRAAARGCPAGRTRRAEGRGGEGAGRRPRRPGAAGGPLPAPTDINPRTEYPRPWMGGRWTLRDIVDYELIATMALLDTVADRRETLHAADLRGEPADRRSRREGATRRRSSFRSRRSTIRTRPRTWSRSCRWRASTSIVPARRSSRTGRKYAAGTFVVPMSQVFARYAKDILEKQTYPEVRRSPDAPPEPPYDVSAWSLGMLLGVEHALAEHADWPRGAPREAHGRHRRSRGASRATVAGSSSTTAGRMPPGRSTRCSSRAHARRWSRRGPEPRALRSRT